MQQAKECTSAASYLKINESIFVHVERAENVVAELFSVAAGEEHLVHVHELGRRQLSIRTVLLQAKQTETSVSLTASHTEKYIIHACSVFRKWLEGPCVRNSHYVAQKLVG
jgi:hypothetical protein